MRDYVQAAERLGRFIIGDKLNHDIRENEYQQENNPSQSTQGKERHPNDLQIKL